MPARSADGPDPVRTALPRIAALRAEGNPTEALAQVDALLRLYPDDLRVLIERAAVLRLAGDFGASIDQCQQILQRAPKRRIAMIIAAEAMLDAKDPQGARDITASALQAHPDDSAALILWADAQFRLDRPQEAQNALAIALKAQPDHRRGQDLMAQVALATRDHAVAISALQVLLTWTPEHRDRLRMLAMAQRGAGDLQQSCDTCRRLLKLDPKNRAGHLILTDNLLMQQDFDGAGEVIDRWLHLRPDDAAFLQRRLRQLRQSHRLEEAAAVLENLPPQLASEPLILAEQAHCVRQSGNLDGALAICRRLLVLDPADITARTLLADILIQAHRWAEAGQVLATLSLGQPGNAAHVARQAMCLRRSGQLAKAATLITQQLASAPRQAALLNELAAILRQQGDMNGSLAASDAALEVNPDDAAAQITRLDTLFEMGDAAAIGAVAQSCGQRLQNTALPSAERALLARLICRAAEGVPADQAATLLRQRRMSLMSVAELLPRQTLWRTYILADQLGLGEEFAPMAALWIAAPRMDVAEARALMNRLFQLGMPQWQEVAAQLASRVSPGQRPEFDLDFIALARGAGRALAQRRREPRGTVKRTDYTLLIGRLLRQEGKAALAARYLRLALRNDPDNAALFRQQTLILIQSGGAAAARLTLAQAESARTGPRWIEAIAFCWAHLDEPVRAATLMQTIGHSWLRAGLNAWYPQILLRLGRMTEARALMARVSAMGSARGMHHFQATFQGVLQIESDLDHRGDNQAYSLVTRAIRRVAETPPIVSAPGDDTRPRFIAQFWNHRKPPAELRPVMQSWVSAEGFGYRRFSQASASEFLGGTLDESWLRALRAASSPTEQSDFFRLCWLMVHGGIYADCDDWLTGDLNGFLSQTSGLVLLREPEGTIANNFIASPRGHPCIVWAATAAKHALLGRHTDTTWAKTGPGLMTRALAWYLDRPKADGPLPALTVLPLHAIGGTIQIHAPLNYKRSAAHWNARAGMVGALSAMLDLAAGLTK